MIQWKYKAPCRKSQLQNSVRSKNEHITGLINCGMSTTQPRKGKNLEPVESKKIFTRFYIRVWWLLDERINQQNPCHSQFLAPNDHQLLHTQGQALCLHSQGFPSACGKSSLLPGGQPQADDSRIRLLHLSCRRWSWSCSPWTKLWWCLPCLREVEKTSACGQTLEGGMQKWK